MAGEARIQYPNHCLENHSGYSPAATTHSPALYLQRRWGLWWLGMHLLWWATLLPKGWPTANATTVITTAEIRSGRGSQGKGFLEARHSRTGVGGRTPKPCGMKNPQSLSLGPPSPILWVHVLLKCRDALQNKSLRGGQHGQAC